MADQNRKPQGLGDLLGKATAALGIRPCAGCDRRAAALNRWLNFSAATPLSQRSAPGVAAPFGASVRLSSLSTLVCDRARIVVCAAFEKITTFICDATHAVTQFICDVFATLTQVICDAVTTITQTICDLTETIMQTICDVSQSICDTICDAFSWLPWPLDDLVCEASRVVCNTVCTVSHVVSTVACTASHIVQTVVCAASHVVTSLVCLFGHLFTQVVCWIGHIVRIVLCILWAVVLAFICILITILQWLECLLRKLKQAIFRIRRRPPKIKHVFVLMLENRSFDHMLGFSGIPGIDGLQPNERFNHDPANNVDVYASPQADFKLSKEDTDPPHEFDYVLTQLCYDAATDTTPAYNPAIGYPPITNTGFVAAYEHTDSSAHKDPSQNPFKVMRCFAPDEKGNDRLPILTTLAREFAVCDRWFSSLPGPTWPNRFFVHAASSGGLDDSPSGFETVTSTLVDGYMFENGTIFDALDRACLDWKVFHGDALPQVFAISGMTFNRLLGKFGDFDEFEEQVMDKGYSPVYTFIEPDYGNVLPVISDSDFTCGNSQHPLDDVTRGEKLIKKVYEVIRASPHWENSVLIVTYDEHGGFHDHVKPPAAVPPGDALSDPDNDHHHFAFDQLGVRVPAVVISPLIPRSTVDHRHVYDHSSVPATLERLFGLDPLTNRDAAANDILHLLTLPSARGDAPLTLPDVPESGFRCDDD
jgi:phospholipase C